MDVPVRLVFVYNVDGNPWSILLDFVHRIRSPETYPCTLCDLTWNRFVKKREWTAFIRELPLPSLFLLRSSFRHRYPQHADLELPAVLLELSRGGLRTMISRAEIDDAATLEGLENLILSRLEGIPAEAKAAGGPARAG